ncbi:DNA-3-methyladenine glycosylase [Tissierella praeacuta]|uniref:DNA-3-methyladenine glycosylase n=1 Tax=Tissierella praeacuta TaxID=43131 RepID=UPI001C10DAFD|nr:DNA-3-methyladenine glycosylase [Tissierella praeacuta]MBU5256390.1 DNA-3-methyladenine glycosylase [Tissierella praeacuta]
MRLTREFYERNTILVARDLLGKILVYKDGENIYKGKIVETEAYINAKDDGAHFNKGLTERTKIIDEVGGHIYIYTIYGMYLCFNVVAEKKGVHGAVLIRAIEPIEGIEKMYVNRYKRTYDSPTRKEITNLTNGPAKFIMAYGIAKELYGADVVTDSRIWIETAPKLSLDHIVRSKRINIDYAEMAKDYLLRFYIKDNPFVSKK